MHRLADDNEDNAPFQIDYLDLGVQAKQLQRVPAAYQCPLFVGETLSSGYKLRDPSEDLSEASLVGEESILDFSDVSLALDETASKSLEVTLARKDNHPRAPDQAEDSSSPIRLVFEK